MTHAQRDTPVCISTLRRFKRLCMLTQPDLLIHGRHAGDLWIFLSNFYSLAFLLFSVTFVCCVCFSDIVGDKWADSPLSMLPIYKELIGAGLRIWVFRYISKSLITINCLCNHPGSVLMMIS